MEHTLYIPTLNQLSEEKPTSPDHTILLAAISETLLLLPVSPSPLSIFTGLLVSDGVFILVSELKTEIKQLVQKIFTDTIFYAMQNMKCHI